MFFRFCRKRNFTSNFRIGVKVVPISQILQFRKMADDQVEVILVANFNGNPRVQWTRSLHERFVIAVTELGGPYAAKPKAIKDTMRVRGLTLRHIKSHLQKYRATLASAGSKNDMTNEKQPKSGNNDPLPHMVTAADDMRGHEFSAVAHIKTGKGNHPILHAPHDNVGHELHDVSGLQTGRKGIPSTMPAPYDIKGPGAYGASEVPIGIEGVPFMLHDQYDIGNQAVYDLSGVPFGTEEIPYMMPQPAYNIESNEVYGISGLQSGTKGMQEQERYANTFTDGIWKDDAGTRLEDYVTNFSSNILPLPNWDATPYTMEDQNVYRESTALLGIEEQVNAPLKEQHNYTGSLDNGSVKKGEGIMKVHQQDVVAHHLKHPSDNMTLYNMVATPYGKGGHEYNGGSNIQREIEGGKQQANKVDKCAMVHNDANSKYMVPPMEQAYHLFTSV